MPNQPPAASAIPESAFSDLWERSLDLRPAVSGADGGRYEIVFPGIRNDGPGPDFKGAVFRRGGRVVAGDVELHLDPSGWRAHGHHADPAFRGVVLQVVLRRASPSSAAASDPSAPPTALAAFPPTADANAAASGSPPSEDEIERLGTRRFLYKSDGFRAEMDASGDPDQVIYQAALESLGYSRNRAPFLALAKALPLSELSPLRREPAESARFAVFAALAVAGGLEGGIPDPSERAQAKRVARRLGVKRRVRPDAWSRFRVRPNASPIRRLRGGAALIADNLRRGVLRGMLSELESGGIRALIAAVRRPPSIGRDFALTMVANAILPPLRAWAALASSDDRQRLILSAFADAPAPPSDAVTRSIAKSLGLPAKSKRAPRHFGLHELARTASWHGSGQ